MTYEAPVDDILLALKTAAGLSEEMDKGAYGELDEQTLKAILEEAGKFASEELAPLNAAGDRTPARWVEGRVETPPGWKQAYTAFREAGWSALPCPEDFGGQALPETVAMAVCEMWNGANLSFGLCPLLTQGAIDALSAGGSDALKARYLPRMVSGEWTGTMNLTEPHAGSDLGPVSTRAERRDDGTYRIFGTKIFITMAIMISPTTSSISCSRGSPTRRKARAASRSSSCRSVSLARTARSARRTTWSAPASSTSSVFTAAPPRS